METKKFIANKFDKSISNFVENENLMSSSIFNVETQKNGNIKFETLNEYWKHEKHELNKGGQYVFEMFRLFRNSKNAVASMLKHLETGKPIDVKTFENQAKLTPKNFTEDQQKFRTFNTFWNSLNAEQKKKMAELSEPHLHFLGISEPLFDFFFFNGDNKITLEQGQYIKIADSISGLAMFAKVLQASPRGFVTVVGNGGDLTLSKMASNNLQIIKPEAVHPDLRKLIDAEFNRIKENGETERINNLETGAKLWGKAEEIKAKAEAKAEAEAKKLANSTKEKTELEKMSLKNMDEVKNFVAKLNKATLIPEHKKELAEKVGKVKETLQKKSETAPKSETTPKASTRKRKESETNAPIITPPDAIEPITAETTAKA